MKAINIANTVLAVFVVSGIALARADGDRNRNASPILPPGENACVYTVPEGIDLEDCTRVESPDHSQVVFFCDGLEGDITVICQEDE